MMTEQVAATATTPVIEGQQSNDGVWYSSFEHPDTKAVVAAKGWKSAEMAVQSYSNLEKLMGADKAGRGIVWPKDENDKDGWNNVFQKMGRPESADKYQLTVPEGQPDTLVKYMAPVFHELGLSQGQAAGLAEKWNSFAGDYAKQAEQQDVYKSEQSYASLQKEWGPAFAERTEIANRAAELAGITQEQFMSIERVLGVDAAAKMFFTFGKAAAVSENPPKGLGGNGQSFTLTPDEAKSHLEVLKRDGVFMKKWMSGDADARAQIDKLNKAMAAA